MRSALSLRWLCLARAGRTLGVIFWQLTRTARRIGSREGPHYAAVKASGCFYDEWLAPKIRDYFGSRAVTR